MTPARTTMYARLRTSTSRPNLRGMIKQGLKIAKTCRIREKLSIFVQNDIAMTQIVLNIDNPDIIPSLRKVLGQIKGVSIAKTPRKKTKGGDKQEILQDIRDAYLEVSEAQMTGRKLPNLDDLIKELEAEEA